VNEGGAAAAVPPIDVR